MYHKRKQTNFKAFKKCQNAFLHNKYLYVELKAFSNHEDRCCYIYIGGFFNGFFTKRCLQNSRNVPYNDLVSRLLFDKKNENNTKYFYKFFYY